MKTEKLPGLCYHYFFQRGTLLKFKISINVIIFHLLFKDIDAGFEILLYLFIFEFSSAFCWIRQKKWTFL